MSTASSSVRHVGLRMLWVVAVLLAWQGLFWMMVHGVERSARPVAMDGRDAVGYRVLGPDGRDVPDAVPMQARHQGLDGYVVRSAGAGTRVRFLLDFDVRDVAVPQALFLAIREEIDEVRLNGQLVQSSDPLARMAGLITSEPAYYALPSRALRTGANRLEIDKVASGFDIALSEFAIGPARELAGAFRWRNLLLTDLALIGVGILAFTLLLCLAVNWPEPDRPRIRALMLLLASAALGTGFLTFSPPVELGLLGFVAIWCGLNLTMAIAILAYVLFDVGVAGTTVRRVYRAWPLLAAVFAVGFVLAAALPERTQFALFHLTHAAYLLVILAGAFAVVVLAADLVRDRARRWFERSVLALCISALVLDRVGSLVDLHSPFDARLPLSLSWSPIIGALLGLSMVFALAREAAQARRTVLDANRVLADRLALREAELVASYAERQAMQRHAAVLEERARIVRDMHDGVGGKLVGLRLQARELAPDALALAIDDTLNDLRLLVDALDTGDDGLEEALFAFERRVRPQVAAAGARFDAHYDHGDDDRCEARVVLQVLRLLQEALTNALRHGQARTIVLSTRRDGASGRVCIVLRDDGIGINADASAGHGLANMHHRARSIGADLQISSSGAGTEVALLLPAPMKAQGAHGASDMPM
mgnify:CR=1 FL=1